MTVNMTKTNVIHFRTKSCAKSNFGFKIGNNEIVYKNSYKYLGFILDEHLEFNEGTSVLADAAGRALGKIINTVKKNKNIGFKTFTTLFQSCVAPILDYSSEVWGFKKFHCLESVKTEQ